MEENRRKWKVQDLGPVLKGSGKAILKGEFLLHLRIERYLIHIVYTFFLFAMVIWVSLMIESTLGKVEQNKAQLKELEIENSAKTYELVKLTGRSAVENRLQEMGSALKAPEQPATVLMK